MNLLKRLYCRLFQKIMYLAIPILPYREPELLKDYKEIVDVLKSNKIECLMLMVSKSVCRYGYTLELETLLNEYNIKYVVYDETLPNPTSDNVLNATKIYKDNNCQSIIAFGGGSIMDCAKAVGAKIVRPKMSLKRMQGLIKIRKKLPLLIAIPTTAGTGSEVTVASVITDSETHHKFVISDFCLIPHYTLLDPNVTVNLPKHITATTGMDALTHAIEAYIGKSRTRKTKKVAIEAVKLIFDNLEQAYLNGDDLVARKNMLYASYLAGMAFTVSYVGYVHAIAHTLGGKYGVSHGLANAVLLPHVLRKYGNNVTKPLSELAKAINLVDVSTCDLLAAETLISQIEKMNENMLIPTKLDCVVKDDIKDMAKLAIKEANPLYPVPKLWDIEEFEEIYLQIL